MRRWIIMICCVLLWPADGMAQGKKGMPAEMAKKAKELAIRAEKLYEQGEYDAALEAARESLAIRERYLGSEHPDVADSLNDLALLHWAQGKISEAIRHLRRSEDARETHLELTIVADWERGKRMFLAKLAGDIDATIALALQTGHPETMHRRARG